MDLKIRLSESLNQRLRDHAENTGATLNSIICLAIDAFVPGGVKPEKPIGLEPRPADAEKVTEPEKQVIVASKQPIPIKPKLSSKPTTQKVSFAHAAMIPTWLTACKLHVRRLPGLSFHGLDFYPTKRLPARLLARRRQSGNLPRASPRGLLP